MSGITGIFHRNNSPVDAQVLYRMTGAVAYRGPDGIGHWVHDQIGLGHLQLCTTPEDQGQQQPLVSPDAEYAITCDGRVDNREELLGNLQPLVPVANSASDATLVLQAYQVWGTACLNYIVGDFAFAIWDGVKRELFCARDRLGIRPFYYYSNSQCFVFGSEIGCLSQHPEVPHQLNEDMVGLYLSGAVSDGEQTFYRGILQLPAGHFLVINDRGVSKHLYWELEPDKPITLGSDEEYVQQFHQLFEEAVRSRLRSTTPVAATLSGGLDSSSIYCTARHLLERGKAPSPQVHTFSAVFNEFGSANESQYINAVLDSYPTSSHLVNSDGYWSFRPLQGSYPQPSHPFPIPHQARHEALLHKIRDEGIRVELSGEGGDELLFVQTQSYFWHLLVTHQWSRLRQDLKKVRPAWRRGFYRQVLFARAPGWVQGLYRRAQGRPSGNTDNYPIVSDEFAHRINLDQLVDETLASKNFKSPYWRDQHASVQWFSRTLFLSYGSQMAHWHGVEARFPFLDSRLVEFVGRVPPEQKVIRDGQTKWLLRQAMKGVLPELVRQRPDKGDFSPLFYRGLEEIGRQQLDHFVENGQLTRLGFVDKAKLARLFEAANKDSNYPVMRFICFFSLELWLQQLFAGRGSSILTKRALPTYLEKGGDGNAHI